jgi:hypothetical protein
MLIQWHHGSGDFATASNWNPASVPGTSDDAEIDAAGTYTVTTSATETVNSLSTIATATLAIAAGSIFTMNDGTGSGVNAGTLAVDNGSELQIDGTVGNTGKITVNASNTATSLFIGASSATLTGSGKVSLSDNPDNLIFIDDSTLTNVNNTIAGAGGLNGIICFLVNETKGVIDASGIHNAFVLDTGSNAINNAGILEATGPGGLQIDGAVDNASTGVIEAAGAHALVDFENNADIVGGTLKTSSGGTIFIVQGASATLDGSMPAIPIGNTGNVVMDDGAELTLLGTIDNSGTITLASTGDDTDLRIDEGVSLQGGGKIVLADNGIAEGNEILSDASTDILTNVDDTISGAGSIFATFVNDAHGIVDASVTEDELLLDPSNAITNAGTLEAATGDELDLASTVDNISGIIAAAGADSLVDIRSSVDDAPAGVIEATGAHSSVDLENGSSVVGGTLKTAATGAIVVIGTGTSTFDGSEPATPIANTGNVVVGDNGTLVLLGTIDNGGTITLVSTGDPTKLLIGTSAVLLQGGGKIIISDNANNEIAASAPPDTLVNVDNTISGAGDISAALTNGAKGVVDANAASTPLVLGGGGTNVGLLEATTGADLRIDTNFLDLNNASGRIEAIGLKSIVSLIDVTIDGGTLSTASGGTIFVQNNSSTFDGDAPGAPIANSGTVVVQDEAALVLLGDVDNSGTIMLASTGHLTELVIGPEGAVLQGGGKISLTNGAIDDNEIMGAALADTLTNVDNTISGAGDLGGAQMTLVNDAKGVIDATGTLSVDTGANEIVNAGLMEITVGYTLEVDSSLDNTGTVEALGAGLMLVDASIVNNGKLLAANGAIDINGATSGNGSATIDNGGIISFGDAVTGITQNVVFANNGSADATLAFAASASANPSLIYDGTISGFTTTKDRIDFTGLTFTGDTTPTTQLVNGNTVLTITEGADSVSVTLAGNETADHFTVSQDSGTGTMIVDPPKTLAATANGPARDFSGASNIALLGNYIASMFASAVGSVSTPTTETQSLAMLAHPHA